MLEAIEIKEMLEMWLTIFVLIGAIALKWSLPDNYLLSWKGKKKKKRNGKRRKKETKCNKKEITKFSRMGILVNYITRIISHTWESSGSILFKLKKKKKKKKIEKKKKKGAIKRFQRPYKWVWLNKNLKLK